MQSHIRIIEQDAIAVMADGGFTNYSQVYPRIPLLVLNQSEINAQDIDRILDSGFYRRQFTDPSIAEFLREAFADSDKAHKRFSRMFVMCYGSNKKARELLASYEASPDPKARTLLLERYYDDCMKTLDTGKILKNAAHDVKVHNAIRRFATRCASWAAARHGVRALSLAHKAVDWVSDQLLTNFPPPLDQPAASHALIQQQLEDLPVYMSVALKHIGAQILLCDDMKYIDQSDTRGFSLHGLKMIGMQTGESYEDFMEEATHYLDDVLRFSASPAWRRAVELDSTPQTRRFMEAMDEARGKQSIFEYASGKLPAEFLADLMLWDEGKTSPVTSPEKSQCIKDYFPHTYPLLLVFQRMLIEKAADILREHRQELEGKSPSHEHSHVARLERTAPATRIELG